MTSFPGNRVGIFSQEKIKGEFNKKENISMKKGSKYKKQKKASDKGNKHTNNLYTR